jgi:hypothetical protein
MKNGNGIKSIDMAKAKIKNASEGTREVNEYMKRLEHPLKNEIDIVRKMILESDPDILEQVKWNAPSFRYEKDFVTFNARPLDKIHLVFHHPSIVQIHSELLEGEYKDRRMMYLANRAEIEAARSELQRIVRQSVKLIKAEL